MPQGRSYDVHCALHEKVQLQKTARIFPQPQKKCSPDRPLEQTPLASEAGAVDEEQKRKHLGHSLEAKEASEATTLGYEQRAAYHEALSYPNPYVQRTLVVEGANAWHLSAARVCYPSGRLEARAVHLAGGR